MTKQQIEALLGASASLYAIDHHRLYMTGQTAGFLGISEGGLKHHRAAGRGPSWVLVEGAVRYRGADIIKYIRANTFPQPAQSEGELALEVIRDWNSSADIRAEFTSFTAYHAFRKAEAEGRVKICGDYATRS